MTACGNQKKKKKKCAVRIFYLFFFNTPQWNDVRIQYAPLNNNTRRVLGNPPDIYGGRRYTCDRFLRVYDNNYVGAVTESAVRKGQSFITARSCGLRETSVGLFYFFKKHFYHTYSRVKLLVYASVLLPGTHSSPTTVFAVVGVFEIVLVRH